MLIRSGGIRAQSRKLSEIAANFGRFLPSHNLLGAPLAKLLYTLSPGHELHPVVKFCEVTPSSSKVKGVNTLKFKPKVKFSLTLKILWGTSDPIFDVR